MADGMIRQLDVDCYDASHDRPVRLGTLVDERGGPSVMTALGAGSQSGVDPSAAGIQVQQQRTYRSRRGRLVTYEAGGVLPSSPLRARAGRANITVMRAEDGHRTFRFTCPCGVDYKRREEFVAGKFDAACHAGMTAIPVSLMR